MTDTSGGKDAGDGAEFEDISLTPEQDEQIKDILHGDQFQRVNMADRRYLVGGTGKDGAAGERRTLVYDKLDERQDAIATQLEDYGLTTDEMALWAPVFDLLCGRCTHITMVIEDFDGGYFWEVALTFGDYREKSWILKRRYPGEVTEREQYDNSMGISHIKALEGTERLQEWTDESDLRDAVENIP